MIDPIRLDAVLMYKDYRTHAWVPLPKEEDLRYNDATPVSFANGSLLEVHGKLFERIIEENTTVHDDIGLRSVPISVEFDGVPVPRVNVTGNESADIEPFSEHGNGTFQFTILFDKPAGEYGLSLVFEGYPPSRPLIYPPLTYTVLVNVNHPSIIDVGATPDPVTVGQDLVITTGITDDTDRPVTDVPVQILFDDVLQGRAARGVFIDRVEMKGADFSDDFETEGDNGWSAHSSPDSWADVQWEHGGVTYGTGPPPLLRGNRTWGTVMDGNYRRGAWSYLYSPLIDIGGAGPYHLRFRAWWDLHWEHDMAYVMASGDGGVTWNESTAYVFTEGGLSSVEWEWLDYNVSNHAGSRNLRLAFVFKSANWTTTLDSPDLEYTFRIPEDAPAGHHDVVVTFGGNLWHEPSSTIERVRVKRTTHFEFEVGTETKTVHRNQPTWFRARLVDNMGQVLEEWIDGQRQFYTVAIYWKRSWTIHDELPPRIGPPNVVDNGTGEVLALYVVDGEEVLGPANVTFRFPGSDFYTSCQMTDVYQVKAHLQVSVPPKENRSFHRGQAIDLGAELRVVPGESIGDDDKGDLLTGVYVEIYWNGQQMAYGRDRSDYLNVTDHLVPSNHSTGPVDVTFVFDGSDIYEPFEQHVTYYVISATHIILMDKTVRKGEWVTIEGVILDERNEPVPHVPVYIVWKRAPEIGRATSASDGTFSLQYYVEYEDRVGNVTVLARFKGDQVYEPSEGYATFKVTIRTILERRDRAFNIIMGEQLQVSAKLYEDWGGYRGSEVQRELVSLVIGGETVATKRTAFDGTVSFSVPVDGLDLDGGYVDLVLAFDGAEHYLASINTTTVFVRADILVTMSVIQLNGRPFDARSDVARLRDTLYISYLVQGGDFMPQGGRELTVHYVNDGVGGEERRIFSGLTNEEGELGFHHLLLDEAGGNITLVVTSPGLIGTSRPEYNFRYIVPPAPTSDDIIEVIGDNTVAVGDKIDLSVRVLHKKHWRTDDMTYALVDPPDGMEITSDGSFRWRPVEGQEGTHLVTVWLYDGERSETTIIVVNVTEGAKAPDGLYLIILGAAVLSVILLAISLYIDVRLRRGGGREDA